LLKFFKSKTFWLSLSIFLTGASGLIYEYILSTVSSYILGNSIEQFSITIALMLFAMGLAGYLQKFISDKNLILKFIGIEILISILGSFTVIIVYWSYTHLSNFYLFYYSFAFLIGFLIGLEIPVVLRINQKYKINLKENISYIYTADFIGAFIGALVWVYILLKYFSILQIGFIIGSINLIVALITFFIFSKEEEINKTVGAFILTVSILILFLNILGFSYSKKLEAYFQRALFLDPVIYHKKTPYQDITITKNPKNNEIRLYLNGNLQFSSKDERLYHELLVHPAIALMDNVQKVLVLGGGDGLAVRELLKYPNIKITLIELDKEMIKTAMDEPLRNLNEDAFFSDRVKIIYGDAFTTIDNLKKYSYDLIIIDLPDPSNINLAKLYSYEFYKKIYSLLKENGLVAIQGTSPYFSPNTFSCINKTLKNTGFNLIKYHYSIPSFGDWGFFIAYKHSPTIMNSKLSNFHLKTDNLYFLTEDLFKSSQIFPKNWIKTKNKIEINSIFNPVIIKYYKTDNIEGW